MGHPSCTSEQVTEINRSLRKSREDAADAPGGNDLYVGEQRMRRRALREQPSQTVATRAPRVLLALYEWIGGYGVRPGHPSITLIVLLAIAWPFAAHSDLSHGSSADALPFVMRSILLLPNAHNSTTTTAGRCPPGWTTGSSCEFVVSCFEGLARVGPRERFGGLVVGLDVGEHLLGEVGLAGEDAVLEQPPGEDREEDLDLVEP
jgi:hypothetical protein